MKKYSIIIMIAAFACLLSKAEAQSDTTVYGREDSIDVQAKFNEDYRKFLRKNLRYPKKAMRNGQQGNVYLRFVIEKDSTISNLQAEGIHPLLMLKPYGSLISPIKNGCLE